MNLYLATYHSEVTKETQLFRIKAATFSEACSQAFIKKNKIAESTHQSTLSWELVSLQKIEI